jgi:hypothetical protein
MVLFQTLSIALLASPLWAQGPLPVGGPVDGVDGVVGAIQGVDANGRIERPVFPPDIKHPERWRYTPPGRIVPGDPLDRFMTSSFFSPVLLRRSDVGTGGGIAFTDIDFRNQDYREFANVLLTYTSEGQQAYKINWLRWLNHRKLENGGIIREDRSLLGGRLGYSNTLTRRFYGEGSRSQKSDETSYAEALSEVGFNIKRTFPDPGDNLVLSAGANYQFHDLAPGKVRSVETTDVKFSGAFGRGDQVSQLWLDLGVAFDSRDSVHQPYRGSFLGLGTHTAALQTGHDLGGILSVKGLHVFPLPGLLHEGGLGGEENPPTDVIAVTAFVEDSYGELPFYSLPSLGGNTLRGYGPNRFTGQAAAFGAIEYRFGVVPRGFGVTDRIRIERVSFVLFYDIGTVGDNVGDLIDRNYIDSFGFGARVSLSREASFRIDAGFSDEGSNLTIGFGNSF